MLLRHTADTVRNSQQRSHELLVARYLQRYAAKNDTIGFFGPVAWAEVRPTSEVSVRHGSALASDAKVNFEPWAVQAMIAAIAQDPAMRGANGKPISCANSLPSKNELAVLAGHTGIFI